jgi:tetratricopeptide (TPR) repeat protein
LAKKIRVQKKTVKNIPEEIITPQQKVIEFLNEHVTKIVSFCIIILLIFLGFWGFKYIKKKNEEKASLLFFKAKQIYIGALNSEKGLFEEPRDIFKEITEKFSNTSSGTLSLFYIGNCQYELKEYDNAISSYEKFLKTIGNKKEWGAFTDLVYDSLGYCYEAKGEYENALKNFQKTINPENFSLKESGYLNVGRCYELLEQREKAIEIYQEFQDKYPDSLYLSLINRKISSLLSLKKKGY